jgi:hypothetical protein
MRRFLRGGELDGWWVLVRNPPETVGTTEGGFFVVCTCVIIPGVTDGVFGLHVFLDSPSLGMYIPTLGVRMLKMSLNSELAITNRTLAYKTRSRASKRCASSVHAVSFADTPLLRQGRKGKAKGKGQREEGEGSWSWSRQCRY